MNRRKRIAVVTGTRAEFGLLEPVLRALRARRGIEPQLIVTGMHLLPKFGRTIDHIRAAGWRVDAAVPMQTERAVAADEPLALARGIDGIARALARLKSDLVLVLGDRIEAFAGASAAVVGRRGLAHIHGGDRGTGDIDDMLRNAITRMAHVHFAASQDAVRRLRRMGEQAWRIHRVGAPGLDDIRGFREQRSVYRVQGSEFRIEGSVFGVRGQRESRISDFGLRIADLKSQSKPSRAARSSNPQSALGAWPYALIIQHPHTRDARHEAGVMKAILAGVEAQGLGGVIIYPCSDPGHEGIIEVIERRVASAGGHARRLANGRSDNAVGGNWRAYRSLPRAEYLRVAMGAAVMVGNSSSGIIESASLGLNAVNVGPRQEARLRCGPNVLDCGESAETIRRAIGRALRRPQPRPGRSVYGDGRAGERIADILEGLIINPDLTRKALEF